MHHSENSQLIAMAALRERQHKKTTAADIEWCGPCSKAANAKYAAKMSYGVGWSEFSFAFVYDYTHISQKTMSNKNEYWLGNGIPFSIHY